MTPDRANAYRRVASTLRDVAPAKLWPSEQACIREAADTLLFSSAMESKDARTAFTAVAMLTEKLVDAERWTDSRARQLLDDIWECGPGAPVPERIAA
jgi:hypothetical protein